MTEDHFLLGPSSGFNALKISKTSITISPRKTMPSFSFHFIPVKKIQAGIMKKIQKLYTLHVTC